MRKKSKKIYFYEKERNFSFPLNFSKVKRIIKRLNKVEVVSINLNRLFI